MSLPTVKTITLSTYTQNYKDPSDAIYVMNRSKENADIVLTAVGDNGRSLAITIPFTFAPLDLTVLATRQGLLVSHEFRRLLASGYLSIVDNKSAEEALKNPRVRKELDRILNVNQLVNSEEEAGTITLGSNTIQPSEDLANVNPLVMQILEMSSDEEMDDDSVETRFFQNRASLTDEDLEYIRANCNRASLVNIVLEELGTQQQ